MYCAYVNQTQGFTLVLLNYMAKHCRSVQIKMAQQYDVESLNCKTRWTPLQRELTQKQISKSTREDPGRKRLIEIFTSSIAVY